MHSIDLDLVGSSELYRLFCWMPNSFFSFFFFSRLGFFGGKTTTVLLDSLGRGQVRTEEWRRGGLLGRLGEGGERSIWDEEVEADIEAIVLLWGWIGCY